MQKIKRILVATTALCMCAGLAVSVAACSSEVTLDEIPAYTGDSRDKDGKIQFNPDLFYRNDHKKTMPDPFVLNDIENTGYYYIYGTLDYNAAMRSKDLVNWEPCGNTLDVWDNDDQLNAVYSAIWAPEVIYDPTLELESGVKGGYVMFFSATPKATSSYLMYVALSSSPTGPFRLVDFTDAQSCLGADNMHNIASVTSVGGATYNFNDYFAKYLFFNPTDLYNKSKNSRMRYDTTATNGYISTIDPHPFVAPDGKKYLYISNNGSTNAITVFEMENWLKPKYETMTDVIRYGYYTVDDYYNNPGAEQVPFESCDVNEGPFMYYNKENGLYYLTYSVGGFGDASYQVAQAYSDNPMGPFTKFRQEQNGCFLSGGFQQSQEVSGSGHHSFITSGDQLYIIYHRHDDFVKGGNARNFAIDEIKWIDAKGNDGKPIKVMYANGPSTTVQPMIKGMSDYSNIAGEAKVSGGELVKGSSVKYLNDGLLSSYGITNEAIDANIGETVIDKESAFEFEFDGVRDIVSVMVYNSKDCEQVFTAVKRIELYDENGKGYCVSNLVVPEDYFERRSFDNAISYVSPCSAVFAEFKPLKAVKVRVVIEIPEGQESVGISEVRILGR